MPFARLRDLSGSLNASEISKKTELGVSSLKRLWVIDPLHCVDRDGRGSPLKLEAETAENRVDRL
jgi:hypothetical protein